MTIILNHTLLPGNSCFGCGVENPGGLAVEIFDDPDGERVLRARFTPTETMVGFPGIVHGGVIFTAMDCLSTWVATLLGPNRGAAWVLRSATAVYHYPAPSGEPLELLGRVREQGELWEPVVVATEARRTDGELCVQGEFKVVPLTHERLVEIAGLDQLPENWRRFLHAPEIPPPERTA
jgi:acyl-coenzyme A thioesterase PaaI-like protein